MLGGSAPGTVTFSRAWAPPVDVATMMAVPGPTAVTRPLSETVATEVSSEA